MGRKADLILTIIQELRLAQHQPWVPPAPGVVEQLRLPPSLAVGDGNQLPATEMLLGAVSEYMQIVADNDPLLKSALRSEELESLARSAFGQTLATMDLTRDDDDLLDEVASGVTEFLTTAAARRSRDQTLIVGCWLIEDNSVYPLSVGPVLFELRESWLRSAHAKGLVSRTSARRIERAWMGIKLRDRKGGWDSHAERELLEAIGPCPVVCSVTTNGLSVKLSREKGILTARLAMTCLSLIWARPSQALKWMNLLYDGGTFHRRYAIHDGRRVSGGSSVSQMPSGYSPPPSFSGALVSYQPLFDELGRALSAYVRPNEAPARPTLSNALFLSLWWYQQACRETSDQVATTKFAASMDALAGGHSAKGIADLLEARFGCKPGDQLMTDGRTAKSVVEQFYKSSTSQLIHGSSRDYSQDWGRVRTTAETIGRLCLTLATDWMLANPNSDDINSLRR